MSVSELATGLYPMLLTAGNIGLGVALYRTGAVVFAVALWLTGMAVLAGVVSSADPSHPGAGTGRP